MFAICVKRARSCGPEDGTRGAPRRRVAAVTPRIVLEVQTPGAGETSDTASAPALAPPGGGRRLAWSTAIVSLATGVSRVLGLVREVVAKNYFGVQGPVNAFQIAFLVPNTVRAQEPG